MPDHIGWDHDIVLNRLRFARANLLLASGHAHFTQMNDHEGSGSIDFHVSLHNPDPTRKVTVTRLRFIPASAGGWATQTPDSKGGTFATLLAPIGPKATASADVTGWVFGFNAYLLFVLRAETSGGYYQDLLLQLPITITPSIDAAPFPPGTAPALPTGAPRLLPIEAPVLLTLHEPVEAIVIESGDVTWIPLTGQVLNCTDDDIIVDGIHYTLEGVTADGEVVVREGDIGGTAFDCPLNDPGRRVYTFNHSIENEADGTEWRSVVLELRFHNRDFPLPWTSPPRLPGSPVVRRVELQANPATDLSCPLGRAINALWVNWNSTQREGLNGHLYSQSNRYALDILLTVEGNTQIPGSANDDNASFYAFDKPIYAMADGTIVGINDSVADNHGRTSINPPTNNGIVIRHGAGHYAVYAHVKQGSVAALGLKLGDNVTRGQEIARLGNAGFSSEPHLHLSYWLFDPVTGVHRTIPLRFRNLEDGNSRRLPGVIVNGTAFRLRQPLPPRPKPRLPKRKITRAKRPRR